MAFLYLDILFSSHFQLNLFPTVLIFLNLILLIFLLLFCYRNVLHQRSYYQTLRPAGNFPFHLDFQLRYNHVSRINGIYAYKRVTVHYIKHVKVNTAP